VSPQALPIGQIRRTRLAQVAAAFWIRDNETAEIVCFRSVAEYVFGILQISARPGSRVNFDD
jgi:sarcosine oxidase, subunit gamma